MIQITNIQELTKAIKDLKIAGLIYNEADLCAKSGIPQTYLSDMKAGRRPISEEMIQRMAKAFPSYFNPKTTSIGVGELTLSDLARMLADHDVRFHEQMERIMDEMGIAKKETV